MFNRKQGQVSPFRRLTSLFILVNFLVNMVVSPTPGFAQSVLNLPVPGAMVQTTPDFNPPLVQGMIVSAQNPLEFDFIISNGDTEINDFAFKDEANKMIKYFLASLTVPEKELWVNLSPYEHDRIIPDGFGQTEMGRDLLAQDYVLKQLTASMVHPENDLGKAFWERVYQKAHEMYGDSVTVPMDTFNKVWIVPSKAVVYEKENKVFIVESHLKVMLETDYLALEKSEVGSQKSEGNDGDTSSDLKPLTSDQDMSKQIMREILIPEIEREVNQGKNFASLRQIFNSTILATWYKQNLRQSLLGQVYADKNKVAGVDVADKEIKEKIYQQYLAAFKKGVVNLIKEETDATGEVAPRKYFSGGANFAMSTVVEKTAVIDSAKLREKKTQKVHFSLNPARRPIDGEKLAQYAKVSLRDTLPRPLVQALIAPDPEKHWLAPLNIETVGDLMGWSAENLLAIKYKDLRDEIHPFIPHDIKIINESLRQFGLRLPSEDDPIFLSLRDIGVNESVANKLSQLVINADPADKRLAKGMEDVHYVSDLIRLTEKEFKFLTRLQSSTVNEIKILLKDHGFSFAQPQPDSAMAAREKISGGLFNQQFGAIENLQSRDLNGVRVLLRANLNVPIDNEGKIDDTTRLEEAMPILKFLLDKGADVVLIGHNGRLEVKEGKDGQPPVVKDSRKSLAPTAEFYQKQFPDTSVKFYENSIEKDGPGLSITPDDLIKDSTKTGKGSLHILQNVRYSAVEEGGEGRKAFGRQLAELVGGGIFIIDAYGDIGSKGASVEDLPLHFVQMGGEFYVGPSMVKEADKLKTVIEKGVRVVVNGGAKEDKLKPVVEIIKKLLANGFVLFGSAPSAQVESSSVIKDMINLFKDRVFVAKDYSTPNETLDIGPETIRMFSEKLDTLEAGDNVIVNGTMGFVEKGHDKGTEVIFRKLGELAGRGVNVIFIGGDSNSNARKYGLDKLENVIMITGGGVPLKILAGQKLAGVKALEAARQELEKREAVLENDIQGPLSDNAMGRGDKLTLTPELIRTYSSLMKSGEKYDPEGFGYRTFEEDGLGRAPRYGETMNTALTLIDKFVQRHFGNNPAGFNEDVIAAVIGIGGQTTCVTQADGLIGKPNRKLVVLDSLGTNYEQLQENWVAALRNKSAMKLLWVVGSKSGKTDETMINFQNTLRTMIYVWSRVKYGDETGNKIAEGLVSRLWNMDNPTELASQKLESLNVTPEEKSVLQTVFSNVIFVTGAWDQLKRSGSLLDRMIKEGFLGELYEVPEDNVVAIEMLGNLGGRFQGISPNSLAINALLGVDVRSMLEAGREEAVSQRTQENYVAEEYARKVVTEGIQHMVIGIPDKRFKRLAESLGQTVPESLGKGRQLGYKFGMQTFTYTRDRINTALDFNQDKKFYFIIDVEGEEPIALDQQIENENIVFRFKMQGVNEKELARIIQLVEDLTMRIGMMNVSSALGEAQKRGIGAGLDLADENIMRQIMRGPDETTQDKDALKALNSLFNDMTPFRQPGVEMAKGLVADGGGLKLFNSDSQTKNGLPTRNTDERKTFYEKENKKVSTGPVFAVEQSGLRDKSGAFLKGADAFGIIEKEAAALKSAEFSKLSDVQKQMVAAIQYGHVRGKAVNFVLYEDRNPETEQLKELLEVLGADRVDFGPAEQHKSRQLTVQGADTAIEVIVLSVKTLERVQKTERPLVVDGTVANYLHGLYPSEVRNLYGTVYADVFKRDDVKTETLTLLTSDLTSKADRDAFASSLGGAMQAAHSELSDKAMKAEIPFQYEPLRDKEGNLAYIFGTSGIRMSVSELRKQNPRIVQGLAMYLKSIGVDSYIISRDTREGNLDNVKEAAAILAANGIKVYLLGDDNLEGAMPTPVIALMTSVLKAGGSGNYTASHNPAEDNGFKHSPADGGAAPKAVTDGIQKYINDVNLSAFQLEGANVQEAYNQGVASGLIEEVSTQNVVDHYVEYFKSSLESVKDKQGRNLWSILISYLKDNPDAFYLFDSMQGTSGTVVGALLARIAQEVGRNDFYAISHKAPSSKFEEVDGKPNVQNLVSKGISFDAKGRQMIVGAVDGDADRVLWVDENGKPIEADDIVAIGAYFLKTMLDQPEYDTVVKTFVTSDLILAVTKHLGLKLQNTPVGFKYIVDWQRSGRKVSIGGENSFHIGFLSIFTKTWDDGIGAAIMPLIIKAMLKDIPDLQDKTLAGYFEYIKRNVLRPGEEYVKQSADTARDKDVWEAVKVLIGKTYNQIDAGKNGDDLDFIKKVKELAVKEFSARGLKVPAIDRIEIEYQGPEGKPARDGVHVIFETGDRIIERPSGTEPVGKGYVEAAIPSNAEPLVQVIRGLTAWAKEEYLAGMLKTDAAMSLLPDDDETFTIQANSTPLLDGGINLDSGLLDFQIKRDGNGIPLEISRQPISTMKIDGFVPTIISVTPVTNLPELLGIGK